MEVKEIYMKRCLELARKSKETAAPNPMVGAVIVYQDRIIGEGCHIRCGGPHAEVNAIASVKDPSLLSQSTLYVSLEPCAHYGKTPPCADLIVAKHIPRVVIGCADPFAKVAGRGIQKLKDAGIEVVVGVCEDECLELNRQFMVFHTLKRPFITLKWAESADGYMDRLRQSREQGPAFVFSTPVTRMLVHQKRACHQAILIGARTALLDNPSLNIRYWNGKDPLRIVLDPEGSVTPDLHLMQDGGKTWVYTRNQQLEQLLPQSSVSVRIIPESEDALTFLMRDLHQEQIQSVLVEGGAYTLQQFIQAGLWDEAFVEKSPEMLLEGVSAPAMSPHCDHETLWIDGHLMDHWIQHKQGFQTLPETGKRP